MITISSYIHRDGLKDIIRRWMYGDLYPDDAEWIYRLVHFNHLYASLYLRDFSGRLFSFLHGKRPLQKETFLKGDLKDAIVQNPPYDSPRIEALITQYTLSPGRFFRETPCRATLFFQEGDGVPLYIGSSRIKRTRRLAEKGARRLIDGIFDAIKRNADELADERAKQLGIRRENLITPSGEMLSEFLRAEERLLEDFRLGRPIDGIHERTIDDVAGVKVILEDGEQERLSDVLRNMGDCTVMDEEKHSGLYNAVNRIVRYHAPKEEILRSLSDHTLLAAVGGDDRSGDTLRKDFVEFVQTGEECVYFEIIASSYQEMLESEIGRCMHEDRIIEQRLKQQYRSHLAKNVEYLMRFLFMFPFSATRRLEALPIKLWNRYLPDYFDAVIADLFGISSDSFRE